MSAERPEESSQANPHPGAQHHDARSDDESGIDASRAAATSHEATILVRGEALHDAPPAAHPDATPSGQAGAKTRADSPASEAKLQMQRRLPALDDDADVGVQKGQRVTRDGKADLAFTGTLRASAAPDSAPQGEWQEYRIYETDGGKYVFSKVTHRVTADRPDTYEAEVFEPTPSSVSAKLLRSARDLAHTRPMTWTDAAVDFFGYDPLAKALYRKLGGQFEEHII